MPAVNGRATAVPRVRRRYASVAVAAVACVFAAQYLVNKTDLADRVVAPLIVPNTDGAADAIVVPGAGVVGECSPNQSGMLRTLLAARAWRAQRAPILVFTGGRSPDGCSIATAMADFAVELGVRRSSIIVESAALNTHENATRTAPVLDGLGVKRILVVTDSLHMRRAAAAFATMGFHIEHLSVPSYRAYRNNVDMGYAGAREFLALAYYCYRGWIDEADKTDKARLRRTMRQSQHQSSFPTGPIAVLGASYAGGWDSPDLGVAPVINLGVDGQQSWEMAERFEREVVAARPRAVIVWGLINDIFRAQPGQMDAALARIRSSYEQIVALGRSHGIQVILATEITVRPDDTWREFAAGWFNTIRGKESYHDTINRHVVSANRWLSELADREGLLLLDFQRVLDDSHGRRRREFIHTDGSHVSATGYAALTEYARPILSKHVSR